MFVHVTVVPAETFRSSGAYALFPSVDAPTTIATEDDDAPGAGAGGTGEGAATGAGAGTGDGVVEGDE